MSDTFGGQHSVSVCAGPLLSFSFRPTIVLSAPGGRLRVAITHHAHSVCVTASSSPSLSLPFLPSPFFFVQGAIVEGSESDIRASVFVIAVTREANPATGQLKWKAVEVAMAGAMLYL